MNDAGLLWGGLSACSRVVYPASNLYDAQRKLRIIFFLIQPTPLHSYR